jgi:hypothetical protein
MESTMKQISAALLAGALCLAAIPVAYPQESPAASPGVEAPAAADSAEASREELEQRIETSALRLVEKVLNAVGDEISEADKQEILSEVRTELETEPGTGSATESGGETQSRDELEEKIETGILRMIEKVISAAGDDISEEEKRQSLSEVKSELESERDEQEHGVRIDLGSDGGEMVSLAVPLLAISLIFGTPILVVIAVLYAGYRKRRLVAETISQYLASGKEVPPEILESIHGGAEKPKNYLQKGFVMVGAGVGIFLAFAIMGSIEAASLGLIPLFIGIAQLFIWKMEKPGNGTRG